MAQYRAVGGLVGRTGADFLGLWREAVLDLALEALLHLGRQVKRLQNVGLLSASCGCDTRTGRRKPTGLT